MPHTEGMTDVDETWSAVPDVAPDAEVDPHFQELLLGGRNGTRLSPAYLPSSMAGPQKAWRVKAAWVLIVMILTVTGGGICLTYGPAQLFSRG